MVGSMTPLQKAATYRRFDARVPRLKDLLTWYRANNDIFKAIQLRPNLHVRDGYMPTQVVFDQTNGLVSTASSNELDEAYTRFNAPSPAFDGVSASEEAISHTAAALVTNFDSGGDAARARVALNKQSRKQNVVVRRSSAIISDFDKAFWVHAFVELYPFGRGGLDEPRVINIGLEEYIRYCLRLSSRRHSRHYSFTFVAFDVLARHRAMQAVYLRAQLSPHAVTAAASVGRSELEKHLQRREDRLKDIAANRFDGSSPAAEDNIRNLFSFITTGMRAHFGSNEERARARSDLLSMQLAYGQPSLFVTISPSSSSTYRVATFDGTMEPGLLGTMNRDASQFAEFSQAKLGAVAASNPMACARYDVSVYVLVDASD